MSRKKKKKKGFGVLRSIILIIAIGVFCYSGYQLYQIFSVYQRSGREYSALAEAYTAMAADSTEDNAGDTGDDASGSASGSSRRVSSSLFPALRTQENIQDATSYKNTIAVPERSDLEEAEAPLTVNWAELRAINPEIVGWLYVDGEPSINYPICRAEDNDYYLHRTFERQYLFAGAIFVDYHNNGDFSDPNTLVYGHNMRNGSMFGKLKYLAENYAEHPYFWILTPYANYRYHIYSIMTTSVNSDVYLLYSEGDESFLNWEQKMKDASEVASDVTFASGDHSVILSTCTSDSSYRKVVIGKCVSMQRPADKDIPTPAPTPTPVLEDAEEYLEDDPE